MSISLRPVASNVQTSASCGNAGRNISFSGNVNLKTFSKAAEKVKNVNFSKVLNNPVIRKVKEVALKSVKYLSGAFGKIGKAVSNLSEKAVSCLKKFSGTETVKYMKTVPSRAGEKVIETAKKTADLAKKAIKFVSSKIKT